MLDGRSRHGSGIDNTSSFVFSSCVHPNLFLLSFCFVLCAAELFGGIEFPSV